MLGYLNAPSPFTDDGWFMTGDAVEQDGEYLRIRGRQSEIINVGGEKVHPAEVESAIQGIENVLEVTVYGGEKCADRKSRLCQGSARGAQGPSGILRSTQELLRGAPRSFQGACESCDYGPAAVR